MITFTEYLLGEAAIGGFKYKVRSTGKKRRKKVCPPGMKPNTAGTSCVPMKSAEKRTRKLAARKARRTVRAKGAALKTRKERKRKKAMRFRKSFGLKN